MAIDETVEHSSAIVHFSRVVAWSSFTAGAASGLVLGLWSFDGPFPVPSWIGEYGDVSRRLLRLGHIAFFGLAMLNLLLARHLPTLKLSGRMAWLALAGMNFGNIVMPMILVAAAAFHPFKFLLPIPAASVSLALAIAAIGAWSQFRDAQRSAAAQNPRVTVNQTST